MNAVACFCLEFSHKVVFAHKYRVGEHINGQVLREMGVDIFNNLLHLWVVGGLVELFKFIGHEGAVQQNHKLYKKNFRVQLVGKALALVHLFNLLHVKEKVMLSALRHVHNAGAFPGPLKAVGKINLTIIPLFLLPVGKKVLGHIDNNAFVEFAGVGDRAVDFPGTDKENVSGLQGIVFALDNVLALTINEYNDF